MNLTAEKIKAQVAAIRKNVKVFLIDTAQLKRLTGTQYVNGEARPSYSAPVIINCRLIVRSGSESQNIAAQHREIEQTTFTGLYRMQIPYDLTVDVGDHIVMTDAVSGLQKTLEVIFSPVKHDLTGAVVIQLKEVR